MTTMIIELTINKHDEILVLQKDAWSVGKCVISADAIDLFLESLQILRYTSRGLRLFADDLENLKWHIRHNSTEYSGKILSYIELKEEQ